MLNPLKRSDQKYKIQFVAKVTGINPHTIRAWEKRYQAVLPLRDETGRRVYSENEIRRLELLKKLVAAGNDISDVANLESLELESILLQFYPEVNTSAKVKVEVKENSFDQERSLQNLIFGLSNFKLDVISHELKKAQDSLTAGDFVLKVIGPFLTHIKSLKENNQLADFQKTSLFAIMKLVLFESLLRQQSSLDKNGPMLIFSPEGALNELCSICYALLASEAKLPFHYLGGSMSAAAASEVLHQLKHPVAIIPFSYCHAGLQAKNFIQDLKLRMPANTKLFVGQHCSDLDQLIPNVVSFKSFQELSDLLREKNKYDLVH